MIINSNFAEPARAFEPKTQFPGSRTAISGLRYYTQNTGRWLSRDPIQEYGGVNCYAILDNNLINKIDVIGLYEVDTHRYLTEFIARNAGFEKNLAAVLGRQTQALDDPGDTRDAMYDGRNRPNMEKYHFPSQAQLSELRERAMQACKSKNPDFTPIGEYFHALEDTYSHSQGLTDRDWNYFNTAGGTVPTVTVPEVKIPIVGAKVPLTGDSYGGQEIYGYGHARQGHHPDWTWEYPEKSMKMAETVYNEMLVFSKHCGKCGPVVDWSKIKDTVSRFIKNKPSGFYKEHVYVLWIDNVTFSGYDQKIKILGSGFLMNPMYKNVRK